MKKYNCLFYLLLIVLVVLFLACTTKVYEVAYPVLNDGLYDSEFPYKGCSKQLQQISESVKLVNSIAYYRGYIFSENWYRE